MLVNPLATSRPSFRFENSCGFPKVTDFLDDLDFLFEEGRPRHNGGLMPAMLCRRHVQSVYFAAV